MTLLGIVDMATVPTLDLEELKHGDSSALAALDIACRDHGFFLLSNHGLDTKISAMWAAAESFFALPRDAKLNIQRTEQNPLGYYDRELTKQKRDLKEVFDFKAGGYRSKNSMIRSQWPETQPEFKTTMSAYFQTCTELAATTTKLIYQCLGLPSEQVDDDYGDAHTSSMRLNYYPTQDPLSADERKTVNELGDMALHHHTDPGTITLLVQDQTGGLQALSKSSGWIDVPPVPGTIVVNLGDTLQVQTNDIYRAAVHRVVPMTTTERYSTPFFYQPRYDAIIKPLSQTVGDPLYQPFSWRDYIRARVSDNFTDLGDDDIQIARYRIS
jgi:isopenicillin N synthase-like dioxygenase